MISLYGLKSRHPSTPHPLPTHWARVRAEAIRRDGHACRLCAATAEETQLEAHHRTYERWGHEKSDDLTTLCKRCHSYFHKTIGRT